MPNNSLFEQLLGETNTPLKIIPIVDKEPAGISEGSIWFDKGKNVLHVVRDDGKIIELSGNNIQLSRSTIAPEYYSTMKYSNLSTRLLTDYNSIPMYSYTAGYKVNQYFDFNYLTSNFVYINTNTSLTIFNINTSNETTFNAPSNKQFKSIFCSTRSSLCYIMYADGSLGYFDLNNVSNTGTIALPNSNEIALQCTQTLNFLFILSNYGNLYGIPAGTTTLQNTGYTNVSFISDNYNAYNICLITNGNLYVLNSNNYQAKKIYNNPLTPHSFLYDSSTENLYFPQDRYQNYALTKTSNTHCFDVNLQNLANEYIQLTRNQYSLNFQGGFYRVTNFSKFSKIETPAPIYQLSGYDDGVCLVDKSGNVHYFLQSINNIYRQNILNISNSYAFQQLINDRYQIVVPTSAVSYASATPDSDYQNAKTATIQIPQESITRNISQTFTIIQFQLTDSDILNGMGTGYNSIAITRNGSRLPFTLEENSNNQYILTIYAPGNVPSGEFVVLINYSPVNSFPMNYTLQPRTSIAFKVTPPITSTLHLAQLPVFIDKTKYSKYQVKINMLPSHNYRISYLFNNQYPNSKYTRFVAGTVLNSTIACCAFNSDVIFLISEIQIENFPNTGVQIVSTLIRDDVECRECVFIPESELTDVNGLYNMGSILLSGGTVDTLNAYVTISRVV